MVKILYSGRIYDTDKEKDNKELRRIYNSSLENKMNLTTALAIGLLIEDEKKKKELKG